MSFDPTRSSSADPQGNLELFAEELAAGTVGLSAEELPNTLAMASTALCLSSASSGPACISTIGTASSLSR